jgi:predicted amidohydrolase YtcJ
VRLPEGVGGRIEVCISSVSGGVVDVSLPESSIDVVPLPTGILRERAVELIVSKYTSTTGGNMSDSLSIILEGLQLCASLGLTSVQTNDSNALRLYQSLLRKAEQTGNPWDFPMRVFLTPDFKELFQPCEDGGVLEVRPIKVLSSFAPTNEIHKGLTVHQGTFENRLFMDRVKIFCDGSLGANTAAISRSEDVDRNGISLAMLQNSDGFDGVLVHEMDTLRAMICQARLLHYRIELHAIGDVAALEVSMCFIFY